MQPPLAVLERMLTLRIHLDCADESNGALWVSPITHHLGRIAADGAAAVAGEYGAVLCEAQAGDVLLLGPLLLHASRKASLPRHRRWMIIGAV